MKRCLLIIIWSLSIVVLLSGCLLLEGSKPVNHTFLQERKNVAKVEICTRTDDCYPIGTIVPITSLTTQEIDSFWTEVPALAAYTILPGETDRLGDLLFRISYVDGTQELLGYEEQCVIHADGSLGGYRGYAFRENELTQLFSKYADPEMLAKNSGYFSHYWSANND